MKKILPLVVVGFIVLSGLGAGAIIKPLDAFEFELVIITPKEFMDAAQKLAEHKKTIGIDTIIKTTQDIYDEFDGRDNAEQIKYFIKYTIEKYELKYVLLFGGMKGQTLKWYIPVRYVLLDDGTDRYTTFFTDLYYSDIYKNRGEFEDWDSNQDNIFAEWGKDSLDLHPDVCIGRLPSRNLREANNIVNKIIEYESNPCSSSWFNKMVAVGGDSLPDYPGIEGEETCDVAVSYMDGFEINKLYITTGNIKSSNDLLLAINQGCGFVVTRGRGGQDRVRMVYPDANEIIVLQNKQITKLKNKNMYPVVVLGECIHGKIDVSILNIFKFIRKQPNYFKQDCIFECIASRLLNKANAGAIAVLTNTNLCFGTPGDSNHNNITDDAERYGGYLAVEFFRLYGEEDMRTLGDIHTKTIENYVTNLPASTNKIDCKSVLDWILLGDPSLRIGGYY
jgi:hypothetical protein